MKLPVFIVCSLSCFLVLAEAQQADVAIYPRPREDTKLAVADFIPLTFASQDTQATLEVFNQVLWNDLKFSAFFQMPSKSFYPLKPLRFPRDVSFENWQAPTLDVDFLIFGNLQVDGTQVTVEAYLYDVKTQQQVLGKRYTVSENKLIRRVVHEFADQVVFQLSAGTSRGISRSQIAFTSLKGDSKEIYVMDYDGFNQQTITANGGLNKFPEWSADNSTLAFVSNLPNKSRWELWLQGLKGGRNIIPVSTSYVSSPAISPTSQSIAFSSRSPSKSDPDIYVTDLTGKGWRNLSNHPGIDTSPTWSPTGHQIAFVSDRTGTPQIWMVDADGSNLQRLVTEGGHCDSPNWSPNGRFVAYSWQAPTRWKHDVYVIEVASGKIFQLTSGNGSNENPHWSPDARHIAFQSTRTGSKQIFIMNADGKNVKQITAYGINGSPAWSRYIKLVEQEQDAQKEEEENK